jgi:hypothetical protein
MWLYYNFKIKVYVALETQISERVILEDICQLFQRILLSASSGQISMSLFQPEDEATGFSGTSLNNYQTTRRNIVEDKSFSQLSLRQDQVSHWREEITWET